MAPSKRDGKCVPEGKRRFLALMLAVFILGGGMVLYDTAPTHAVAPKRAPAASRVAAIQARLSELGYLPTAAVSGAMDPRTRQALEAFQGWEGLERNGVAGPKTLARLATAARPEPLPGPRSRLEVHLGRQVLLLIRGDRVVRAIHVSSGAPATPTPTGEFRVFRKERRSWSVAYSVSLPWASYFTGGVAFHGYPEVPAYPASHGCVRLPLADAPTVYSFARLGTPVRVVT
jgi:hypothetical protein